MHYFRYKHIKREIFMYIEKEFLIVAFAVFMLIFLKVFTSFFDEKEDEFKNNFKKGKNKMTVITRIEGAKRRLTADEKENSLNVMRKILEPIHQSEARYYDHVGFIHPIQDRFESYDQYVFAQHYFKCYEEFGCNYDDGEVQRNKHVLCISKIGMAMLDKERQDRVEKNSNLIANNA